MRYFQKIKYIIGAGAATGLVASFVGGVYALDATKQETPLIAETQKTTSKWDSNWDKRDPRSLIKPAKRSETSKKETDENTFNEQLESKKPTASRNLILIRHGQYNLNGTKDEERYLTALGIEQANYTGKRLKDLGLPYTVIVQSSMCRATETARIISGHLPEVPVKSCDLLREGAPCQPEPPVSHWRPEYHQFFTDGARIEAAFRKYFHRADPSQKEDTYEILVCHANVIRYFVCRALQLPPEAWLRMSLHNASITWLTIRPSGRVSLRGLGDCGHMPVEKLTTT